MVTQIFLHNLKSPISFGYFIFSNPENFNETRVQDKFASFILPDQLLFLHEFLENGHHKMTCCHFSGVVAKTGNGRKDSGVMTHNYYLQCEYLNQAARRKLTNQNVN